MRVLFVSRNFFPEGVVGGAQACIKHLADGLVELGHEVAVLSLDNYAHSGTHKLYEFPEYRLCPPYPFPKSQCFMLLKGAWHTIDRFGWSMQNDYRKVINEFQPNIINTNVMAGIGTRFWQVARQAGVPLVHTVYDYYLLCIKSTMRAYDANCEVPCRACRAAALWPSQFAATAVSQVIYVSHHMRKVHQRAGVFPSNTPSTVLTEAYGAPAILPKRTNLLQAGKLTLGFFGRISPEKGLEQLLSALRAYPNSQWELRIGGTGTDAYISKIKNGAKGLPVTFLGFQDATSFYSSIDALVVPSLWHDPAPRVAFEGGIHGAIPIVSNRGGLPELVSEGKLGLIFDVDNYNSLHRALDIFLTRPALVKQFRLEWEEARGRFHPRCVAEATSNVYQKAVKR